MTKEQVKAVLDRVLTWPDERQQDVASILQLMEDQDGSGYRLSDEQAAEVERRLLDKDAPALSLDAFNIWAGQRIGE